MNAARQEVPQTSPSPAYVTPNSYPDVWAQWNAQHAPAAPIFGGAQQPQTGFNPQQTTFLPQQTSFAPQQSAYPSFNPNWNNPNWNPNQWQPPQMNPTSCYGGGFPGGGGGGFPIGGGGFPNGGGGHHWRPPGDPWRPPDGGGTDYNWNVNEFYSVIKQ